MKKYLVLFIVLVSICATAFADSKAFKNKIAELNIPQIGYTIYMRYPLIGYESNENNSVFKKVEKSYENVNSDELFTAVRVMGAINYCAYEGKVKIKETAASIICHGKPATELLHSIRNSIKSDVANYLSNTYGMTPTYGVLNNSDDNRLLGLVGINMVRCYKGFWRNTCQIDYITIFMSSF
ncbi:MAG: hypothetical protein A2583_08440 [Bdellovibrionales bacterium RIFOXYD1_FULL_53_11]|nr:MAG: hypothetical protein A2583_08440 [Bdellovibrionales bacterium RIFOXYD1_FULL_53_11]